MRYLLDVNVLVAWGWSDHTEHDRAVDWLAAIKKRQDVTLLTSAIPQLGFVRVSAQRAPNLVSVGDAAEVLAEMLRSIGEKHEFLADDQPATEFPAWCESASRTTDGHLHQLAVRHGLKLATLDTQIRGAYVLPAL